MNNKLIILLVVMTLFIVSGCAKMGSVIPETTGEAVVQEPEGTVFVEEFPPPKAAVETAAEEKPPVEGGALVPDTVAEEQPPLVITVEEVRERFGVEVLGVWDQTVVKKEGAYRPTPEEVQLIYNFLSSLPQEVHPGSITVIGIPDVTAIKRGNLPLSSAMVSIGGTYDPQNFKIQILGIIDDPDKVRFLESLAHEVGHLVSMGRSSIFSNEELQDFVKLYNRSRNESDFAREYGMNDPAEDFATVFEAYFSDTEALLQKAEKSSILQAKVEIVSHFFDGYRYKVEKDGTIKKNKSE